MSSHPFHNYPRPDRSKAALKLSRKANNIRVRSGRHRKSKLTWEDQDRNRAGRGLGWSSVLPWSFLGLMILAAVGAVFFIKRPALEHESASTMEKSARGPLPLPREIAENFTQSMDPQVRLQWCREPKTLSGLLDQFPGQALKEVPFSIEEIDEVTTGTDLLFHRFTATFSNGDRRLLAVVETDQGLKVDWEAYARHSRALQRWTAQARAARASAGLEKASPAPDAETPETAEVRIFLSPSNYYNFHYNNSETWTAYRIESPDIEGTLTAYAENGTPTADLLRATLTRPQPTRLTLLLENRPQHALKDQFLIRKVLAIGWVKSGQEFDEVRHIRTQASLLQLEN